MQYCDLILDNVHKGEAGLNETKATALGQRRAWCHNESVQTELDDQKESKLVNLLSALQVKIRSMIRFRMP